MSVFVNIWNPTSCWGNLLTVNPRKLVWCCLVCTVLTVHLAVSMDAQQAATNEKVPNYQPSGAQCPDPERRSAEIGGREISSSLVKDNKLVVGARVELFS